MKLSMAQITEIAKSYVSENSVSVAEFVATRNNSAGLLDKIGKLVMLDTSYVDKLATFEGERLSFGKTIEEVNQDLILPEAFSEAGTGALALHQPTYRPAFYSYTLGRKKFPISIRYDDLERAVHFEGQYAELMAMKSKRLFDSYAVWRYQVKREILNKLIGYADDVKTEAETFATNKDYDVGTYLKSGSPAEYGIAVKPITKNASDTNSWANAKANGYVILLDLVQEIAVPTDTSTGEAFVKQLKKDLEIGSDISEGHSLNGNTLGATSGLVLLVKQGIAPVIDVDVLAGAFHQDKVSVPAEQITIKDFGGDTTGVYAILMDRRMVKLHNTYEAVREALNEDGDFLNMVLHSEDTAFISRNCFFKIYRNPSA
jgi:hypothetical protein